MKQMCWTTNYMYPNIIYGPPKEVHCLDWLQSPVTKYFFFFYNPV